MASVLVFQWLSLVAIAFPFILLGGMVRRERRSGGMAHRDRQRFVPLLLASVLGAVLLLTALQSSTPLRWAFVLAPMVGGFVLGLALHGHRRLLVLQPALCWIAALIWCLGQAFDSFVSSGNPERHQEAFVSAAFYSMVNLVEVLIVFLLVSGVMRLLKRENAGLALVIALCALALDTDIPFLSYAVVPLVCAALTGALAEGAGLAPKEILEVLAQRLTRHPKVAPRINRSSLARKPVIRRIAPLVGPALAVAVFVIDLNTIWSMQRMAEDLAVVVSAPGYYVRYGEDWSYTLALLVVAAVPLGAAIRALMPGHARPQKSGPDRAPPPLPEGSQGAGAPH